MLKRSHFQPSLLPYLLVAPQIIITLVFFIWPALQALYESFYIQSAFGTGSTFVGLENFIELFEDPLYIESIWRTFMFSGAVALLAMSLALTFAALADRVIRGAMTYRTLLIWPYAIAPAVAGALWIFMFDPTLGIVSYALDMVGVDWNQAVNGTQAMALVIMAAAWKQIAYNFLFFLAGMQAIPPSVYEAAAIDGASPMRRFFNITLPLLAPTTFFLLVMNVVYAFFDTFGIIDAMTQGGPANATEILVYKVYQDGFVGLDLGGSAAQSVVLMFIVIALTVVQFKFVEKKVQYA
ncbi:MAG TPA: sn-glycerol-3-phosphate ABC transporter permease UgpA [Orrella sp.]